MVLFKVSLSTTRCHAVGGEDTISVHLYQMPCQIPEVICVWSCRHVFVFIGNGNEVTHQEKGFTRTPDPKELNLHWEPKKAEQIHFLVIRWSPTKDLFYRHLLVCAIFHSKYFTAKWCVVLYFRSMF